MKRIVALCVLISISSVVSQAQRERARKAPLTAAEQAAALNTVREYALRYTASLPDYTCIQSTRQVTMPAGLPGRPLGPLPHVDLIEEQLSFVNGRELRKVTKINERQPSDAERTAAGTLSRGEFGNLLDTIFEPRSGAEIRWERAATLDGRRVYVFAYRIPQSRGYTLVGQKARIRVPFEGLVYADDRTGAVLRIEMKCIGIPPKSEYRTVELTLDYKLAKVAGQEFLLPSRFNMQYGMTGMTVIIGAEYKSYKRFSADSTISFGEPNNVAPAQPEHEAAPEPVRAVATVTPEEEGKAAAIAVNETAQLPEPPATANVVPAIAPLPLPGPLAPALAAPPVQPDTVFRTSTRLVEVSVIAQDKDGKPVTGLRRDEFQIFDNAAPQEIRVFRADHPDTAAPPSQTPGMFTNRMENAGSSVLLLDRLFIDAGNSVFRHNVRARQTALQALQAIPPGDRIALYALGCRFQVIREFTSDRNSLLQNLSLYAPAAAPCVDPETPEGTSPHQAEAIREIAFGHVMGLGEFEFKIMADHLAGIPGRKNLIWVTSAFRLSPANLQRLIDANVAIYPVDAIGSMIGTEAAKKDRYAPLDAFAAMTGGVPFYDRDDLDAGIKQALADGRVSYTLGFYPDSGDANPAMHRLAVRVSRPGVALRYRTSYQLTPQAPASANPVDDLVQAINRPVDATVIPVIAHTTRNGDRLDLSISLDVPSLNLEWSDGLWKGKAELVTRFETADGLVAGEVSAQTVTFNLRAATYESMLRDGDAYPTHSDLAIPPKAVELKVLVGNLASGKIGTLTIPLSEVPSAGN